MRTLLLLLLVGALLSEGAAAKAASAVVSANAEGTAHATTTTTTATSSSSIYAVGPIQQMQASFDRQGYIVLRNLFDPDLLLTEWVDFEEAFFQEIFETLHSLGHTPFPQHSRVIHAQQRRQQGASSKKRRYALKEGKRNGFREIVMRSNGRYDINFTSTPTTASTTTTDPPDLAAAQKTSFATPQPSVDPVLTKLAAIIPALLHTNDTMAELNIHPGLVVSTPGATDQEWHSDGEHLDMEHHRPCHILNIFIPLVQVTEEMGPTELFPASHFKTRRPPPMQFRSDELNEPVAPELNLGDVLIFDYRVLHRGKANRSTQDQRWPVLIFTISRSDFQDTVNFAETQSMFFPTPLTAVAE